MIKNAPAAPVRDSVRLDIWLWAARFFKTRALARHAIEGGKVEVNAVRPKSSRAVHAGDRVCVVRGEDRLEIDVVAPGKVRGPAMVAQGLYRETEAGRLAREAAAEQRRLANAGYARPQGKPDKRARRLIRALGDIDAL